MVNFHTKKDIKCDYCDNVGHIKINCLKYKNEQQYKEKDQGASIADCDDDLIRASACTYRCSVTTHSLSWVVDSEASFLVTYDRSLFTAYKKDNFGMARMKNHHRCKVLGIGNVNVVTNMYHKLTLKNVRHVLD